MDKDRVLSTLKLLKTLEKIEFKQLSDVEKQEKEQHQKGYLKALDKAYECLEEQYSLEGQYCETIQRNVLTMDTSTILTTIVVLKTLAKIEFRQLTDVEKHEKGQYQIGYFKALDKAYECLEHKFNSQ